MIDDMTDYMLGCDPSEPNIFTMETKTTPVHPLVSDEWIANYCRRFRGHDGEWPINADSRVAYMVEAAKGVRDIYESELTKKRAEREDLVMAIRKAVADYMWSEGCSCCQKVKPHEKAEARLAELLKPDAYDDGSGWDWYKYKTE